MKGPPEGPKPACGRLGNRASHPNLASRGRAWLPRRQKAGTVGLRGKLASATLAEPMARKTATPKPLLERTFEDSTLDGLRAGGFEVAVISSNPERLRVLKNGCAVLFERQPDETLKLAQAPGFVIRGEIGRLWDAGYQKFWLLGPPTDEPFNEPRRPALAEQLKALHRFDAELKAVLGIPSFYNEAIGTTNEISAYDRVQGRDSSSGRRFA